MGSFKAVLLSSLRFAAMLPLTGCGVSPDGDSVEVGVLDRPPDAPSFAEFKASATHYGPDGTEYYVVEWDIPLRTEAELERYYAGLVSSDAKKGVLHLHNGADDVWQNNDQLFLRYCVDTAFDTPPVGVTFATVEDAMNQATRAWERVANVRFSYDPSNNGDCGTADPIPDSRYIKVSRADFLASPCAFGPLSHASWTCAGLDGNTIGVLSTYQFPGGPTIWSGIMMHEVGHTLGLHHEQFHTNGGGCTATPGSVRDVTPAVDLTSIMGYPQGSGGCALTTPFLDRLSPMDGVTARKLYGMPAAWLELLF